MHSHDRTLLARLGFSDPDKKDPTHDLACAYLAEDAQARRIVAMLDQVRPPADRVEKRSADIYTDARLRRLVSRLEHVVAKGSGQYRSTIGFLDVAVAWETEAHNVGWYDWRKNEYVTEWERRPVDKWELSHRQAVLVEVKIGRVPTGDLLRQVKLYAGHCQDLATDVLSISDWDRRTQCIETRPTWLMVATAYPMSKDEVVCLSREGIRHIRLGDGFRSWCNRQSQESDSQEI